jgi:hypothetical protein
MHTKNFDCDESELSFDSNAALSSNNDSISKIMFVKSEKV